MNVFHAWKMLQVASVKERQQDEFLEGQALHVEITNPVGWYVLSWSNSSVVESTCANHPIPQYPVLNHRFYCGVFIHRGKHGHTGGHTQIVFWCFLWFQPHRPPISLHLGRRSRKIFAPRWGNAPGEALWGTGDPSYWAALEPWGPTDRPIRHSFGHSLATMYRFLFWERPLNPFWKSFVLTCLTVTIYWPIPEWCNICLLFQSCWHLLPKTCFNWLSSCSCPSMPSFQCSQSLVQLASSLFLVTNSCRVFWLGTFVRLRISSGD